MTEHRTPPLPIDGKIPSAVAAASEPVSDVDGNKDSPVEGAAGRARFIALAEVTGAAGVAGISKEKSSMSFSVPVSMSDKV